MATKPELADRAQRELCAARDALSRAQAIFHILKQCAADDNKHSFDLFALADTGFELTERYAERANNEATYFWDACSTSQGGAA
ncbi:hypothetical protein [Paraburkholderia sp.]|uniref:hypothetical protein n=1 Tax=Paraburkholderia sp. TaxID=1926495 RepID=UPI003C7E3B67